MAWTHWLLSLDCPLSPELHIQSLVGCGHLDTGLELLKLGEGSPFLTAAPWMVAVTPVS